MPVSGEPLTVPDTLENPAEGWRSSFDKESEYARPGYYSVLLKDYGVKAEQLIKDDSGLDAVVSNLRAIGYMHEGDLGIAGREAFAYEGKEHLQKHHLYVCPSDSAELKRHLAFRDYLRSHPDAVSEYGRLKEDGAKRYSDNVDKYIEFKSPFIEKTLKRIGV